MTKKSSSHAYHGMIATIGETSEIVLNFQPKIIYQRLVLSWFSHELLYRKSLWSRKFQYFICIACQIYPPWTIKQNIPNSCSCLFFWCIHIIWCCSSCDVKHLAHMNCCYVTSYCCIRISSGIWENDCVSLGSSNFLSHIIRHEWLRFYLSRNRR